MTLSVEKSSTICAVPLFSAKTRERTRLIEALHLLELEPVDRLETRQAEVVRGALRWRTEDPARGVGLDRGDRREVVLGLGGVGHDEDVLVEAGRAGKHGRILLRQDRVERATRPSRSFPPALVVFGARYDQQRAGVVGQHVDLAGLECRHRRLGAMADACASSWTLKPAFVKRSP